MRQFCDVFCYSSEEQSVPSKRLKSAIGLLANHRAGIRNKRVQTTMVGAATGELLNGITGDKFEIIQKDIGYSSDADMSDAVEVSLSTANN